MAICGLQLSPNRNSVSGTFWKKRMDSNSTLATMPMVMNTAKVEHRVSRISMARSTWLRARRAGWMRPSTRKAAMAATLSASAARARRLIPASAV